MRFEKIENNENDMAAYGICFDFKPIWRPSTMAALPAEVFPALCISHENTQGDRVNIYVITVPA
jgi:hypothetical protein